MKLLFCVSLAIVLCFGTGCDDEGAANTPPGTDPSSRLDGGIVVSEDASVSQAATPKPTMIAPVSGGGKSASSNYQGRFVITAPNPVGKSSSPKHKATISVPQNQDTP